MADFGVSFIISGKHLGDLMEVLQPYKVSNLDFKVVAGTPTKIRQGDAPGWQVVAAAATSTPHNRKFFGAALKDAGFKSSGVSTHLDTAIKNKALKRVSVKGVNHYVRPTK